LTFRI